MPSRSRTDRPTTADAVEASARRALTDTRFSSLRNRRARTALVVAQIGLVVLTPVAWLVWGAIAGIVVVLAAFGVTGLLRQSVRVVADLPDHVLDERQLAFRNAMYVEAYRYFVGVAMICATVGLVAFVVRADDTDTWNVDLTWNGVMAAFWVFHLLALALPSVVVALRDRDELPVDPDA